MFYTHIVEGQTFHLAIVVYAEGVRKDSYTIGSIIHVTKRGARGIDFIRDDDDRRRFVKSLFYLNDAHSDPYWHEVISGLPAFARPAHWPEREPLVHILAWTLLSNHFHILLREVQENGVAKFMQRLGGSMSMCFNLKYKEKGSLFQGAYHARVVEGDAHMNYLTFYILVKNLLEMYPGGLSAAVSSFDDAWEWAKHYPFSSLTNIAMGISSPIINDANGFLSGVIGEGDAFKEEARELLFVHMSSRGGNYKDLMLETW